MKRLIITNGDSAAERISTLEIAHTVLPWRDVLHDGPVLAGLALEEQSRQRASFIAGFADLAVQEVLTDFQNRDDVLRNYADFDRVELWFEHDLYDQLQLMQILDYFAQQPSVPNVFLVQSGEFLSEMSDAHFKELAHKAVPVKAAELSYAQAGWQAFTSSSPERLVDFIQQEPVLPFMQTAMQRLMQEYPDCQNGLPLSLQLALGPLQQGALEIKDLFIAMMKAEEAKFMGDLGFCHLITSVFRAPSPLLVSMQGKLQTINEMNYRDFFAQKVCLSDLGKRVLSGEANHVRENGIERWIGGVHLTPQSACFYDQGTGRFSAQP